MTNMLEVAGGLTWDSLAAKDGMSVEGNLYIHDGSLDVSGGTAIYGGVNITAAPFESVTLGGGAILSSGLHVTDGVTISTSGLNSGNNGPISINGGLACDRGYVHEE